MGCLVGGLDYEDAMVSSDYVQDFATTKVRFFGSVPCIMSYGAFWWNGMLWILRKTPSPEICLRTGLSI